MTDYEKLEWLISETKVLIDHHVTPSVPAFQHWHTAAERFLIKRFGKDSLEYNKFIETRFTPSIFTSNTDFSKICREGLIASKLIFQTYLEEMEEENITEENLKIPNTEIFVSCSKKLDITLIN